MLGGQESERGVSRPGVLPGSFGSPELFARNGRKRRFEDEKDNNCSSSRFVGSEFS